MSKSKSPSSRDTLRIDNKLEDKLKELIADGSISSYFYDACYGDASSTVLVLKFPTGKSLYLKALLDFDETEALALLVLDHANIFLAP